MSGASDSLDPVEAAQNDISRSKQLIASTLDDLSRHHSWLESYHREERRRTERLRRQEARRRLKRKRQRAVWVLRRFAVTSFAATRAAASFLVRTGTAFALWAAPRLYALTVLTLRLLSAGAGWTWRTIFSLSRTGLKASARGLTWTIRASDVIGVAFRQRLSVYFALLSARAAILAAPALKRAAIGWTRTRHRTRRYASTLEAHLTEGWSRTQSTASHWTNVKAPKLRRVLARKVAASATRARAKTLGLVHMALKTTTDGTTRARAMALGLVHVALKLAADSWSWTVLRIRRIPDTSASTGVNATSKHRALIVRRTTALVCVERWRARLPTVRAS